MCGSSPPQVQQRDLTAEANFTAQKSTIAANNLTAQKRKSRINLIAQGNQGMMQPAASSIMAQAKDTLG